MLSSRATSQLIPSSILKRSLHRLLASNPTNNAKASASTTTRTNFPGVVFRSFSTDSDTASTSMSTTDSAPKTVEERLVYKAPMGDLITRLKRISITSCMISVVGLPILVFLKNGTWPDFKQLGLGGFAFLTAGGSTVALHFVFGPYVIELYELIPGSDQESSSVERDEGLPGPEPPVSLTETAAFQQPWKYKATKMTLFGTRQQVVFDSQTDVTPYSGGRPFANFIVEGKTVLYCHPELLDETTRLRLLKTTALDDEKEEEKAPKRSDEDELF